MAGPSASALRGTYLGYLEVLDDRRWDDLAAFVHDEVVHNDRTLSREEYAAMIADDVRRIPDLRFVPELLVVDGATVACRLAFECTLAEEFGGAVPTGRPVRFAEHVLYRFRDGRIERVWSLVDLPALREQSSGAD